MSDLILPSLEIQNFRAFGKLTVPTLSRINLITGKNNVGKTSLIEALWLYASGGSASSIRKILADRDELGEDHLVRRAGSRPSDTDLGDEHRLDVLRSLFNAWPRSFDKAENVYIGPRNHSAGMSLGVGWYAYFEDSDPEATEQLQLEPVMQADRAKHDDARPWITVRHGKSSFRYRAIRVFDRTTFESAGNGKVIPHQYVGSDGLSEYDVSSLWDEIQLTDLEHDVIEALQMIAPSVERVSVRRSGGSQARLVPIVKMRGTDEIRPLRSLGDGMSRVFNMSLAIANASGGILLVDEIENGLHYSVMAAIWRSLFQAAMKLNVQVFATTHSWDCITAFQQVSAEHAGQDGALIRLDDESGGISATGFDERKLAIAAKESIEVR